MFSKFFHFLSEADPSVFAAVVGAIATVLVGLGGVFLTQIQLRKRAADEAHRSIKVEFYKEFLDVVAKMIVGNSDNVDITPPSEQELVKYLVEFKTNIMLWGSPQVINATLKFSEMSSTGKGNMFFCLDELYRAIRDDIGLSNKGLDNRQLIKMYLSDPSELDDPEKLQAILSELETDEN
ncbi:hypothetical protein FIV46_03565 [Emcibacter nanhaiensis]|uniref:Uncharacterized protein n=1 Tax=Emcibacter nanhaiensis TaxID=1505037 RepID=A0A501PTZ5_9PROT|nr:hypothetical protein FIV46_03565 [Emcibacter nanhaiensis]